MDEMRIVILGKTGVGKSSVANTILGEKNVFQIGNTGNSKTSKCQQITRDVGLRPRRITLIDTPGLFDTDQLEEELRAEIVRCIIKCSPGPHAFLIVFKVDRFTDQEQEVINKINKYFSDKAFKYATVLFAHGDQLDEGQTIEEYFHNNQLMRDLMKKCGGRPHVIDNKYWKNNQPDEYRSNQFQVKQLLKTIDHMMEANKGSCYTNEMLQDVKELIQEEEEEIRQSPGNMPEEEIIEEAERRVSRLLINLAGISTGALLGALLGVALVVREVVKALKKALSEEKVQRAFAASAVGVVGGVVGVVTVGGVGVAVGGEAALIAAGSVIGAGALVGAVKGGLTGYDAAREANTAGEAAKRAATAVFNKAKSVFKDQEKAAKNKYESKPLIGPDS
ncbi:GTPase IMAP family member 7 [Pungitius pungitius]|uniref:GTPase IMAP family member 7 n=1 Tax=Pungitius pungitius TaxID=134920 RepID=UPI002E10491B